MNNLMYDMFGNRVMLISEMVRDTPQGTVCLICGAKVKYLYMTEKGFVCKADL